MADPWWIIRPGTGSYEARIERKLELIQARRLFEELENRHGMTLDEIEDTANEQTTLYKRKSFKFNAWRLTARLARQHPELLRAAAYKALLEQASLEIGQH